MASITELLNHAGLERPQALQELYARLYPEIKRLARSRLHHAGGVTSLNTTALVNEGFLRIAEQEGLRGRTREQFFCYVGQVLRAVVIDHLRHEGRDKRGGGQVMVTLSAAADVPSEHAPAADLLAVDRALRRMVELDPSLYELLEMVSFAGMTLEEVADLRGTSKRTINRELSKARALLQALLGEDAG